VSLGEYWGAKSETALKLPCEESPAPGRPLTVGRDGIVNAQVGLTGNGIQSGEITAGHLDAGVRGMLFGGAEAGDVEFGYASGGATTVVLDDGTSYTSSSNVFTLTRDLSANVVQVHSGVTLKPAGYRIQCARLVLIGSAVIQRDGPDGGNGATPTAGAKATGPSAQVLGGGSGSQPGGAGGTTASQVGSPGTAGDSATLCLGSAGGAGGNGGQPSGGGAGGSGAAAGTVTSTATDVSTTTLENIGRLQRAASLITGGTAGGGGGGGGATAGALDGGGGGGGGAAGGVLLVFADEIVLSAWTGRISANGGAGGAGGNGESGVPGGGRGAGAGGGGGGFAQVVYRTVTGGSLVASPATRGGATVSGGNITAHGGALGAPGTGGSTGATAAIAGTNGFVVIYQIGARPSPKAQSITRRQSASIPYFRKPRLHAGHYIAMTHRNPLS